MFPCNNTDLTTLNTLLLSRIILAPSVRAHDRLTLQSI